MKYFAILFVALFTVNCAAKKEVIPDTNYKVTEISSNGESYVIGTVVDQRGENIPFVKVMLIQAGAVVKGVVTDIDGRFKIQNIEPGIYDLEVNALGYEPNLIKGLDIKASSKVEFEMIESKMPEVISLKPIIYLYPEKETEISVKLNYKGKLTHTYPAYPETGWKVKAQPDGTLFDENGKEFYALFWEGKPTEPIQPTTGFVIPGDETVSFLEAKLEFLGLNRREANEFIMFWLPQMENNPFNLIHFSTEEYENLAELNIVPKPETIIRVMMITKPLNEKIAYPIQDIPQLKRKRSGFTVVEWGGSFWPEIID